MKLAAPRSRAGVLALALFVPIAAVAGGQDVPAAASDNPVFRVTTTLIQVDAVVTDAKGRQIIDLSADDFEILADGHPQPITYFSYVRVAPDAVSAAVPSRASRGPRSHLDNMAPPVSAIGPRPEDAHRTIVLFVDDLGLSWESTACVRQALGKFIDRQMQPGDLVAVVRSGGGGVSGSGVLQPFTADKRLLHIAVDRIRWNPGGRRGLEAIPAVRVNPGAGRTAAQASAANQAAGGSVFAGTFDSLSSVVGWLRGTPGRKSVIVFSDGFSALPSASSRSRLEADHAAILAIRTLIDSANRAGAVIYTVDPRGVQPLYPDARDDIGAHQPIPRGQVQQFIVQLNGAMNGTMATRLSAMHSDQFGMEFLAEETGGLFYQDNDVNDGIAHFLEDQKGYYLIGYKPGGGDFDDVDGRRPFHRIRVKVRGRGLRVRSRSGFIGTTDDEEQQRSRRLGVDLDQGATAR
jgi:VWFA-related protein